MNDLVGLDCTYQFLSRKYRIHDRNIGCSQIRRDGKDQNAGISRSRSLVDQASGRWMSQTVDDYPHVIRFVPKKIEGSYSITPSSRPLPTQRALEAISIERSEGAAYNPRSSVSPPIRSSSFCVLLVTTELTTLKGR
jgi:hypothetical protein